MVALGGGSLDSTAIGGIKIKIVYMKKLASTLGIEYGLAGVGDRLDRENSDGAECRRTGVKGVRNWLFRYFVIHTRCQQWQFRLVAEYLVLQTWQCPRQTHYPGS
jgi:hypothetical protein